MKNGAIKRIQVKDVFKTFHADIRKNGGALASLVNFLSVKPQKKDIPVLKNASFDVYSGEIMGIIGDNGSGKSTLLRLIAGVYQLDQGKIKTNGRVVYLTGLNQGSIPRLTMRENIFLMGSVAGLSQKDIQRKFNEIVEFSGLGEFVDMKVYQFSTGMVSRLNFSVIIHCIKHQKPEILLIDEVLSAGGDIDFQEKAIKKMEELIQCGAAVIIVSHDLNTIKKYCDKVIWLGKEKVLRIGHPSEVVQDYLNSQ